jgi:predicted metal-binding protein
MKMKSLESVESNTAVHISTCFFHSPAPHKALNVQMMKIKGRSHEDAVYLSLYVSGKAPLEIRVT